ncbi:DUF7144 family membrane protein [Microlunatus ginsengisoli]|uniref:DUF7144 domain-containing protein n=1 Tax=Microlunatus ginsengisoli TaxID=363863 RepID=A0ABP7ADW2_9ACTN
MSDQKMQMAAPWAHGVTVFAGVILIVGGGFQAFEALAAIVHDKYLVVLPNYIYAFDLTTWGWIHLILGLALVLVGICLLMGQGWAHIAGIVLAGLSAIVNFMWLPYSPLWAIIVIAIDVLVIWALISSRRSGKTA